MIDEMTSVGKGWGRWVPEVRKAYDQNIRHSKLVPSGLLFTRSSNRFTTDVLGIRDWACLQVSSRPG